MREITFTMTLRDWQEGFWVGLVRMTPLYRVVWSSVLLLMTVGLSLILWSKGYPSAWPPTQLPPRSVVLSMGLFAGIILSSYVLIPVVMGYLSRTRTVQLLPLHLADQSRFFSNLMRWKNVTAIVDTGEHLCFCHNFPASTVVPRSAFPNQEQADAFLEQAALYWRRETGRTDLPLVNTSDVWPPAPRRPHSKEQDKTP